MAASKLNKKSSMESFIHTKFSVEEDMLAQVKLFVNRNNKSDIDEEDAVAQAMSNWAREFEEAVDVSSPNTLLAVTMASLNKLESLKGYEDEDLIFDVQNYSTDVGEMWFNDEEYAVGLGPKSSEALGIVISLYKIFA